MYATIPALGALPWAPERRHVSTGYELPNSLPSASLQQLQALVIEFSTQQQLAFEAELIAAARVHHTITNTKLTDPAMPARACTQHAARRAAVSHAS